MRLARFEREAQRLAGTEEMGLADDIVEHTRPEPVGKRRIRLAPLK